MTVQLSKKQKYIVIGAIIALAVILLLLFLKSRNSQQLLNSQIPGGQIIAVEGRENIYESDIFEELKSYPLPDSPEVREHLKAKIIADSRALQQAESEGKVILSDSIFNSPDKDYKARIAAINSIRTESQVSVQTSTNESAEGGQPAGTLTGTVISIWFNNVSPGNVGYDRGKEIAGAEINKLQRAVALGQITIQEAANRISNNFILADVDTAYKSNAKFDFAVNSGEKITFDADFDAELWKLSPGSVSEVFLLQDQATPESAKIDSVYMFAQITGKS